VSAGRQQDFVNRQKSKVKSHISLYKLFRSYEQDQTNATIWILLLPKYDDDNDVRDCWNNSIQA
jgi:hypothetical protein